MRQRGLISLDLLLDTRYGTLKCIDEPIADALVESSKYFERHDDNFDQLTNGVIDRAQYKERYKNRDGEVLFRSRFTDFLYMLRQDVKEGLQYLDRGIIIDEIIFDVNVWPYKLNKKECEIIRRAVAHKLPPPAKVEIVNMSPQALTPRYVESNYEMMAWYDHEEWLTPNQDLLIKHPLPLTVLLTPMIAHSGVVPDITQEVRDPFLARSAILSRHITLHYLSVPHVCHNPVIARLVESQRHSEQPHPEHPHQSQDEAGQEDGSPPEAT